VKSLTIVTTHTSLTADRNIFQCSSTLAKRKSTENQVISVLCGVLPFLIVTPAVSGISHLLALAIKELRARV